ncbi:MAG: DUF3881 family protein [Lachnospiraceae bacterium]|nr:DUF3881 family protein [Lachnospiraceae bacterium]
MHSYLRAIGFSKIKNKSEQDKLIAAAINNSSAKKQVMIGAETTFIQIDKSVGGNLGLTIIAENDKEGNLTIDHSFPYCKGSHTTIQPEIILEPHIDKEAYSGISEDYHLGYTIIYALQNISDYVKSTWSNEYFKNPKKVKFGALSLHGRILYGVHLEHNTFPYDKQPISNKERHKLIAKAKSGDMDALENLTLEDMDTYSLITKRIKDEDLFTVIETYFMPYGMDNEHYTILGKIKKFEQITNEFSDEMVYNLTVVCNGITIDVAINALDLEGEPKIGRRFRGIIWLQGQIDFS